MNKSIYKPKPISGFPEFLPDVRALELKWIDHIRRVFESYGFVNIETPAVEEIDVLLSKGETDKEIYALTRLQTDEKDKSDARLALHFDLTVPFARYTAQHFNELTFPFKRYQIQKVWRGERPQAGRFREFYQCDIDVINVDSLPLHFDAEMPAVIWEVFSGLPGMKVGDIQIKISNRKILIGFLESLVIRAEDNSVLKIDSELKTRIIREVDKFEKIGIESVLKNIDLIALQKLGLSGVSSLIFPFLNICKAKYQTAEELENAFLYSEGIDTNNPILKEGIEELIYVMKQLAHLPKGAVVADLSIVRGLDYYTGTVYETVFIGNPSYGSICSGGRYDDLAGSYISKHLPGVGISIGFSRLFEHVRTSGLLPKSKKSLTDVLVTVFDDAQRVDALKTAAQLRQRGLNVEVYHAPQKFQKQIDYANKKEIPFVWFLPAEGKGHEVKNMATREQVPADPKNWEPS